MPRNPRKYCVTSPAGMPSTEGLFELRGRAAGKAGCALARDDCPSTACSPIGSRHFRKTSAPRSSFCFQAHPLRLQVV